MGPLLLAMTAFEDQRWAYVPSAATMALWVFTVAGLFPRPPSRLVQVARVLLLLLPLIWMLPARGRVDEAMDQHDRFVASVVDSMQTCDGVLPEDVVLVLAGDADRLVHIYRLSWGLVAILQRPNFVRQTHRQVIALNVFSGCTPPVPSDLVTSGLSAWLEVGEAATTVRMGSQASRIVAAPVGFDGTLTAALVDRLLRGERIGYVVQEDFDGEIAVCSGHGSALVHVPVRDGFVRLLDVLTADANSGGDTPRPINGIVWVPADGDPDNPLLLCWRDGDTFHDARLVIGTGFVRRVLALRGSESGD